MKSTRTVLAVAAWCLVLTGTAAADINIHQKHRFDARPGATVVIDVSFHEVEVTAEPGDTVDVAVDVEVRGSGGSAKNIANDLQPKFLEEGDKLIIRSKRKGWKSSRRSRAAETFPAMISWLSEGETVMAEWNP